MSLNLEECDRNSWRVRSTYALLKWKVLRERFGHMLRSKQKMRVFLVTLFASRNITWAYVHFTPHRFVSHPPVFEPLTLLSWIVGALPMRMVCKKTAWIHVSVIIKSIFFISPICTFIFSQIDTNNEEVFPWNYCELCHHESLFLFGSELYIPLLPWVLFS